MAKQGGTGASGKAGPSGDLQAAVNAASTYNGNIQTLVAQAQHLLDQAKIAKDQINVATATGLQNITQARDKAVKDVNAAKDTAIAAIKATGNQRTGDGPSVVV